MLGHPATPRGTIGIVLGLLLALVLVASPLVSAALPPPGIDAAPPPDLRIGFLGTYQSLNPFRGTNDASLFLYGVLYDFPFSFDQDGTAVGNAIASASCAVANCSVWNYTVRPGVYWSDGSMLTAGDVNFTWNYDSQHLADLFAYEPFFNHVVVCNAGNAGRCGSVPSATVPGNLTVYFDRPFVAGTDLRAPVLQMAQWVGISPECAQGVGACTPSPYQNPTPIGTGPFIADPNLYNEWLNQASVPLHLTRNPRYHAVGNVTPTISIRGLYLYSYSDPSFMAQALLAGSLDVAQFTAASIGAVTGKPNILTQTPLQAVPTWNYIGIQQNDSAHADSVLNPVRWDTAVRRAMAMATNKDYIVAQVYNGLGVRGSSLISPITPAFWYDPVAGGDNLTFNVAAANALLNASGYTTWTGGSFGNGYREATSSRNVSFQSNCLRCANPPNVTKIVPASTLLQFTIAVRPPSLYPEEYNTALYLQAQYAQIGVQLIVKAESTEYGLPTDVYSGNVEMYIWFWSGDPDPNYLVSMQSSWTLDGWNDNNWNNATYNAHYLAELGDQSLTQRIADVKAAEKVQYDLSPDIITIYPFGTWAMRTDLWAGWGDWAAHPYRQLNVPWGANPLFFGLNCPSCGPVSPVLPPTPPVLSPAGPLQVTPGVPLTVAATATDPNASVKLNFTWTWGDGSITNHVVSSSSPADSASHAWANLGTYVVEVTVYDGYNAPVAAQNQVTVDVVPAAGTNGWLAGVVNDTATPAHFLAGASVQAWPGGYSATTDASGGYNLTLPAGTYTVSAAASFHDAVSFSNVRVITNETTRLNVTLPVAKGSLQGTVLNAASAAGVAGATVTISGPGVSLQTATDAQGRFSATLAPGTITLSFAASGYTSLSQPGIGVVSNATRFLNVTLVPTTNPIGLALVPGLGRPGVAIQFFANLTTPAAGTWTLDFGDGSTATGSHGSGTTPIPSSHAYAVEGNFTVTLTATSYMLSATSSAKAVIDGTPPVTVASLSGTGAAGSWFPSPVTVTLTASDERSGVAEIEVSLDTGPFQAYVGPVEIAAEGLHTVSYRSVDRAGNIEIAHTLACGIDMTNPSLQLTAPGDGATLTSSGVTVSWSGSDAGSGIARYMVSVDGAPRQDVGMNTSLATNLADGPHTITVWAFDKVGNNIARSLVFRVDTNVFSPSGPYAGAPTYAIIVAAVAVAAVVLWRRRKRNPPAPRPDEERT